MCVVVCFSCICGCGNVTEKESKKLEKQVNQLEIDWDNVNANVKKADLGKYGWYIDEKNMESDEKEYGNISFANYDVAKNDFKSVDYQLSVEYGKEATYENGADRYYDKPAINIMLISNKNEDSFSATYDLNGKLLGSEGKWFLKEKQTEYINKCIKQCKEIVGESNGK